MILKFNISRKVLVITVKMNKKKLGTTQILSKAQQWVKIKTQISKVLDQENGTAILSMVWSNFKTATAKIMLVDRTF